MPVLDTSLITKISPIFDDDYLIIIRKYEPYFVRYDYTMRTVPVKAQNGNIARTLPVRSRDNIYLEDEIDVTAADCTAGLANVFVKANSERKKVIIPPVAGGIKIGEVPLKSAVYLQGSSAGTSTTAGLCGFKALAGAGSVFTAASVSSIFSDLYIDGNNRLSRGVEAQSAGLMLRRVVVKNCLTGVGGGTLYDTRGLYAKNVTFYNCQTGLYTLIDSHVIGCNFLNCTATGVDLGSGGSSNFFLSCLFAYNQNWGAQLISCNRNNFENCVFDRNYYGAAKLNAAQANFTGGLMSRNGRNDVSGQQSHVFLETGSRLTMTNVSTLHGKDDDGTGADTPRYGIFYNTAGITDVTVTGGDHLNGFTTSATFTNSTTPSKISIDAVGMTRTKSGYTINYSTAGEYFSVGSSNITNTNTGTYALTNQPIAVNSRQLRRLTIYVRNASTASTYGGYFNVLVEREAGSATLTPSALYGRIGTAGVLQFGAGTLNLAFTSIAADASTFNLTCTNTTGATVAFTCRFLTP